jgi:plasmid maintenance system antidote protein VapI
MLITMSDKEIQRLAVLQDVRDHRITQVRAAEILNLSTRQITRLLQKKSNLTQIKSKFVGS